MLIRMVLYLFSGMYGKLIGFLFLVLLLVLFGESIYLLIFGLVVVVELCKIL